MSYILSAVSDCGFRHSVNQDSVLVRKLQSAHDEMVFACICDGMAVCNTENWQARPWFLALTNGSIQTCPKF